MPDHCQIDVTQGHYCIALVPIFSHLSSEEIAQIASITEEKRYGKHEGIYRAGTGGGNLYVLHDGTVKIYRTGIDGKERVIRVLGPGDFFGELSLFSGKPNADHADALTPTVMCVIEGKRLKALMAEHPSIALKILEELSERLEDTERTIEENTLQNSEQRLARFIIDASDGAIQFDLNVSKGTIASRLGMTQETLSRKLASLQEASIINLIGRRGIMIIDMQALQEISEGGF